MSERLAFELGYRSCEKGMNPQAALEYFYQVQGMEAKNEVERLRSVLAEIAKGRGPYKPDPLDHAESCVLQMKSFANQALRNPDFRLDEDGEPL